MGLSADAWCHNDILISLIYYDTKKVWFDFGEYTGNELNGNISLIDELGCVDLFDLFCYWANGCILQNEGSWKIW